MRAWDFVIHSGKRSFSFSTVADTEKEAREELEAELTRACIRFSGLLTELEYPFKIELLKLMEVEDGEAKANVD